MLKKRFADMGLLINKLIAIIGLSGCINLLFELIFQHFHMFLLDSFTCVVFRSKRIADLGEPFAVVKMQLTHGGY